MQVCEYAKYTKCTDCEHPYHNQCKKFLQIHAKYLMRNILKNKEEAFTFTPIKDTDKNDVLYSKKADLAKSAALQFALEKNKEVVPMTTSVAMDLSVNKTDEIDGDVVYLTVTNRVGDSNAIIQMIESFVDITVKNGGKVAIYIDKLCLYKFKYNQAEQK